MWLTSFVLRSFAQARDIIDIDEQLLNKSLSWIVWNQQESGCFKPLGTVHHTEMKVSISNLPNVVVIVKHENEGFYGRRHVKEHHTALRFSHHMTMR